MTSKKNRARDDKKFSFAALFWPVFVVFVFIFVVVFSHLPHPKLQQARSRGADGFHGSPRTPAQIIPNAP